MGREGYLEAEDLKIQRDPTNLSMVKSWLQFLTKSRANLRIITGDINATDMLDMLVKQNDPIVRMCEPQMINNFHIFDLLRRPHQPFLLLSFGGGGKYI